MEGHFRFLHCKVVDCFSFFNFQTGSLLITILIVLTRLPCINIALIITIIRANDLSLYLRSGFTTLREAAVSISSINVLRG